jgi:hypothetical protein
VGQTKDVLSGLEGQLKLLKKDLKVKDEKIMKLTEHSMMMASHMDKLKGEVLVSVYNIMLRCLFLFVVD